MAMGSLFGERFSRVNRKFLQAGSIVALACCSILAQTSAPARGTRVTSIPEGVELSSGSSILDVQVVGNQLVRVHIEPEGQSTARTLVMDPVYRPAAYVHRFVHGGSYTLSAPGVSVRVREAEPWSITVMDGVGRQVLRSEDPLREAQDASVTMMHGKDETFYGIHGLGREDRSVGLTRNDGGTVAAGYQGDSGAPYMFTVHYGFLVDSDGGKFTTKPGSFTFEHSSRPDIEYFVSVGPPLQTMAVLSQLVGPPPLPPKWTLGFLNSQWGSTQAEVERIVANYRQKEIPIDGFILDFDWKAWGEDNYGEWRWNSTSGPGNVEPDKFPDGASGVFAKRLGAEGVKLAGILKPRILLTVYGHPNQLMEAAAYATAHDFWYPGEAPERDYFSHRMARDLDFSIPAERAWFWYHLIPSFRAGMVAWWTTRQTSPTRDPSIIFSF